MEGTKSAADTLDFERSGREAFLLGRSSFMRRSGPRGSEDPAMSNSKSGLKSQTPKGALNMKHSKGKLVNIPVPWKYASQDMLNF